MIYSMIIITIIELILRITDVLSIAIDLLCVCNTTKHLIHGLTSI